MPVGEMRYPLLNELRKIEMYNRLSSVCANNHINHRSHHKKKPPDGWLFFVMVGRAGFEPATNWLKANCSTD